MNLKRYLPIAEWLPKYDPTQLKGDLAAGLTVGVMLIPQGMAYAMIAGLPPIYGLYASTLPLVIYALLGTSRQLAVGPVAMVSLLTASGIGALAEGGTETYIALAITLAFFVGMIQFLLGVFRLGFLVNFLSHPVISGFTSAAALIIGLSQLKHLLGVDIPRSHHVHEILFHAIDNLPVINWLTFAIGMVGILLIVLARKINKAIPGSLLAVVFGILLMSSMGLSDLGISIVGQVPEGLPSFSIPSLKLELLRDLLPIALAIALVSFMESIAVAKAIQSRHKNYKVEPDQELLALGLANVGGSFLQSYPVTGGFSRTAVNDQAGAKTGMASLFSAFLIVMTLLFLTPLFYYLPNAILASVIMVAVFGLIDYKEAAYLWQSSRADFWMLLVTFIATLTMGIELGIGLGVVLSLAMIIFKTSRPHLAVLGKVPGTYFYRNISRFQQVQRREDLLIVRFDAPLYFANVNYFKEKLEELVQSKASKLEAIIFNAESISDMDSSAIHTVKDMVELYRGRGIKLYFTGVIGPVRDVIEKAHLTEKIGARNFFMGVQEAVDFHDNEKNDPTRPDLQDFTLQTNK